MIIRIAQLHQKYYLKKRMFVREGGMGAEP